MRLTDSDIKALIALATYQYLNTQQFERLGVGKTAKQIRDYTLKHLESVNPALIKNQDFGVIAGHGRLHKIYYLTPKAIETVADILRCSPEEIVYPQYGIRYANDYFHRSLFVDFHIALRQWIESQETAELEFFQSYYTKYKNQGSKTSSINQLRFKPSDTLPYNHPLTIEPDGIFRFKKDGKTFLCAVEVHRKADSKYITQQLDRHITAIDQHLFAERFEQDTPNLVLSVHDSLTSFKSVQKRLLELPDFERFIPYFHFALSENLHTNFINWVTADNQKSRLFN